MNVQQRNLSRRGFLQWVNGALAGAGLTVGLLSFGAWQSWWLSTLWLVAALYAASDTKEPPG